MVEDIKVGLRKKVLDLVDPRLQSSILEDGRVSGHDKARDKHWQTTVRTVHKSGSMR